MKQSTEIVRVVKDRNFTVIDNRYLRRNDLSWRAKGILTYILSLPDDWVININEIQTHATEGSTAFRSGWNELKDKGYVARYAVKDKKTKKILRWETIVRENVDLSVNKPHVDFPQVEKPQVEKPQVENQKLQSTYITKDLSKQSTNNTNAHSDKPNDSELKQRFEDLWNQYPNKKGKPKAFTAYKSAIKAGTTDSEIAKGIENYKREIEIKRTDKQYIAHGSTWFSNKRWTDEYDLNSRRTEYNPNAEIDEELGF